LNILGINCWSHDTAAALLQDGEPVAFVEEERLNREKHTRAFPDGAVAFCLRRAGIRIEDVNVVVFAHRMDVYARRGLPDLVGRLPHSAGRLLSEGAALLEVLRKERDFRRRHRYAGRVVNVDHHQAHAAAAFFASGFDEASILTLDRMGDFLSTTLGHGKNNRLETLAEVRNPHSLGEVYSALTWYLGFHPNADEGKVMGLAPFGRHIREGAPKSRPSFARRTVPREPGVVHVPVALGGVVLPSIPRAVWSAASPRLGDDASA
jgi:carbamoyltransferase